MILLFFFRQEALDRQPGAQKCTDEGYYDDGPL